MIMYNDHIQWIKNCSIDVSNKSIKESLSYVIENNSSNKNFNISKNQQGTIFLERIVDGIPVRLYTKKGQNSISSLVEQMGLNVKINQN